VTWAIPGGPPLWYTAKMVLSVDIRHWLDEHGELPSANPSLRRKALRIAQLIEAGALLEPGEFREVLVACSRRFDGHACEGLLWVAKLSDERLHAYCRNCAREEIYISGWQDTRWSEGPMAPQLDPMAATLQNIN
jgi:hypothetical protein